MTISHIVMDFDGPIVNLFDPYKNKQIIDDIRICGSTFGLDLQEWECGFIEYWAHARSDVHLQPGMQWEFDIHVHNAISKREADALRYCRPDATSIETLIHISKCFQSICILSNNSQEHLINWFDENRLSDLIGEVIGRTDYNPFIAMKPNPQKMTEYLSKNGYPTKDTLFIGDTESDMKCASALGVKFLMLWTEHSPKKQRVKRTYPDLAGTQRAGLIENLSNPRLNNIKFVEFIA